MTEENVDVQAQEAEAPKVVHDLAEPAVVRELFAMAASEVLYRLVQVSRKVMTAEKARDMDDALARHLARALMGENPEFKGVDGWSGMPCAIALSCVEPKRFAALKEAEGSADIANPRVMMVLGATAFYRAVYDAITEAVSREGATQETVQRAMSCVVDAYALAAMQPVA